MINKDNFNYTIPQNSLTEANYPIAVSIRIRLIHGILDSFYQKFFDWSLPYPGIEINSHTIGCSAYHNMIFTNLERLLKDNFCDIGITLTIAHEMWHILSHQVSYIDLSEPIDLDNSHGKIIARAWEKIADIIAWFVLKKLELEWYSTPEDLVDWLNQFYDIWNKSTFQSFMDNSTNIHGTGTQRKKRINTWYTMSDEDLYQYLNSNNSCEEMWLKFKTKILSILKKYS